MDNSDGHFVVRNLSVFFALICFFSVFVSCQTMPPSAKTEMADLANELEEANQKIEEIYHRVSVVQFMVDNHERTITDLEKKLKKEKDADYPPVAVKEEKSPASLPEESVTNALSPSQTELDIPAVQEDEADQYKSPEYIYNQGFSALKTKNYTKAISMFKTIVSKYPGHNLADNAIYWTGEIHYTRHDFPEAIRTFKRLIEKYPEGGKVADALLKIGYSYYSMTDNENAREYLKRVVVDYPFTVAGSKAEAMLNKID